MVKRHLFSYWARLLLVLLVIPLCTQCGWFTTLLDGSAGFSDFQRAVLEEINLARTKPAEYARDRLQAGTSNGAYEEFISASAVPALKLEARLCKAADDYASYLARNNLFSHSADGTPAERITRSGYEWSACGENLAAGSATTYNAVTDARRAARDFVKMLIIDAGVIGVGHRKNIRSSSFTEIGVGFARLDSAQYKNYHVQKFAKPK